MRDSNSHFKIQSGRQAFVRSWDGSVFFSACRAPRGSFGGACACSTSLSLMTGAVAAVPSTGGHFFHYWLRRRHELRSAARVAVLVGPGSLRGDRPPPRRALPWTCLCTPSVARKTRQWLVQFVHDFGTLFWCQRCVGSHSWPPGSPNASHVWAYEPGRTPHRH